MTGHATYQHYAVRYNLTEAGPWMVGSLSFETDDAPVQMFLIADHHPTAQPRTLTLEDGSTLSFLVTRTGAKLNVDRPDGPRVERVASVSGRLLA